MRVKVRQKLVSPVFSRRCITSDQRRNRHASILWIVDENHRDRGDHHDSSRNRDRARRDPDQNVSRYEQTLMIPQFLDLEKLTASHRHGMLRLTLPLRESVKPRRVQIDTQV